MVFSPCLGFRVQGLGVEFRKIRRERHSASRLQAREENLKLGAGKRCCFTCPGEPGTKRTGPELNPWMCRFSARAFLARFRPMYDQMIKNLQHSNKADDLRFRKRAHLPLAVSQALAKAFGIKKAAEFMRSESHGP